MNHFFFDVKDSDYAFHSSSRNKWVPFNATRPAYSVKWLLILITKAHRHILYIIYIYTQIASMELCCFLLFHGKASKLYNMYTSLKCYKKKVDLLTSSSV